MPEYELVEVTRLHDPHDWVGRRCDARHPEVGRCNRRCDHVALGDDWHHAMTNYGSSDVSTTARYWRFRER